MVESIMFVGFGFLTASLFALAIVPLVHGRAVRLTVRRLRRMTRLSVAECQAEKDLLRARFAMSTRRLELRIEELSGKMTSQLAELGKQADAINRMRVGLGDSRATVSALEARKKALTMELKAIEEALSPTPVLRQIAMFAFVIAAIVLPFHDDLGYGVLLVATSLILVDAVPRMPRRFIQPLIGAVRFHSRHLVPRRFRHGLGPGMGERLRAQPVQHGRPADAAPPSASDALAHGPVACEERIAGADHSDVQRSPDIAAVEYVASRQIAVRDQHLYNQSIIVVLDDHRLDATEIRRPILPDDAAGLAPEGWIPGAAGDLSEPPVALPRAASL